jgi:hypothetical protein
MVIEEPKNIEAWEGEAEILFDSQLSRKTRSRNITLLGFLRVSRFVGMYDLSGKARSQLVIEMFSVQI